MRFTRGIGLELEGWGLTLYFGKRGLFTLITKRRRFDLLLSSGAGLSLSDYKKGVGGRWRSGLFLHGESSSMWGYVLG